MQETELTGRAKGTIFPTVTIAHQFIITKGGWNYFEDFLKPYHLSTAISRCVDLEDFFNGMLRKRVVCRGRSHQFQFPEDLIRNEFDLDE